MLLPKVRRLQPPRPIFRGEVVTVCIAAVCSDLKRIVSVSDRLISSEETSAEAVVKVQSLDREAPWVVMYAGHAANFLRLYARIRDAYASKEPKASAASVVAAVEEAYRIELLKIHESEILAPYGMTREEFFEHGKERFSEYKFNALVDLIEQTHTDVTLLLAGFDGNDGCLFEASCWGVVKEQPLDFHAIGSGRATALGALYPTPAFATSKNFNEIVYRLCAAKFAAESTPTVGQDTFVWGVSRGGNEITVLLPEKDSKLRAAWKRRSRAPVPESVLRIVDDSLFTLDVNKMKEKAAKRSTALPQAEA